MNKFNDFFIKYAEWVTITGGIITLLGTMFVNIKSTRESKETLQIQGKLLAQSTELNEINTGGSSYPYVNITEIDHEFGIAQFHVSNQGKYPLYITELTITAPEEYDGAIFYPNKGSHNGISEPDLEPKRRSYPMSEIYPGTARMMQTFPFQIKDGSSFTLQSSARNGMFVQQTYFHKTETGWWGADRIINITTHKIVFENIPNAFPKELIKWGKY